MVALSAREREIKREREREREKEGERKREKEWERERRADVVGGQGLTRGVVKNIVTDGKDSKLALRQGLREREREREERERVRERERAGE